MVQQCPQSSVTVAIYEVPTLQWVPWWVGGLSVQVQGGPLGGLNVQVQGGLLGCLNVHSACVII